MERADIPQLAALYRQFWGEASDEEKMCAQFDALRGRDTHILLSAEEDGRLAGSVMGVVCAELYGDCRPFLVVEDLAVAPAFRRRGVGRALMEEVARRARERRCTQMILVTESGRADACAFYEAVGFHPTANKGYKKKL